MMIFDEGYTTVIISFKVLILILSCTVATINIKTHFLFEGLSAIFRGFENADLTVHVTSFAIMSSVVSGYGAVLLYMENRPEFREAIQTAFRLYLVWDVALFLELSLTTVILYYCYTSAVYIFQEGFYDSLRKYGSDLSVSSAIDQIQEKYSCCGNDNYMEWFKVRWNESLSREQLGFPNSCCNHIASEALNIPCTFTASYNEAYKLLPHNTGCLVTITWWYRFVFLLSTSIFLVATLIHLLSLYFMLTMKLEHRKTYSSEERQRFHVRQIALFKAAEEMGLRHS